MSAPPHQSLEVLVPASPWYFRGRLFVGVLLLVASVVPLGLFFVIVLEAWNGRPLQGGLFFALFCVFVMLVGVWGGVWSLRDGLGAERSVEGRIRGLKEIRERGPTILWVEVEGDTFRVPHALGDRLRVGQYVSARIGRFHGDLISLAVSGAR